MTTIVLEKIDKDGLAEKIIEKTIPMLQDNFRRDDYDSHLFCQLKRLQCSLSERLKELQTMGYNLDGIYLKDAFPESEFTDFVKCDQFFADKENEYRNFIHKWVDEITDYDTFQSIHQKLYEGLVEIVTCLIPVPFRRVNFLGVTMTAIVHIVFPNSQDFYRNRLV